MIDFYGLEAFELVSLFLGTVVFVFLLLNRKLKDELPYSEILIFSFSFFLVSWLFTNLEHLIFYEILNLLEHVFLFIGALGIVIWSWMTFGKEGEK